MKCPEKVTGHPEYWGSQLHVVVLLCKSLFVGCVSHLPPEKGQNETGSSKWCPSFSFCKPSACQLVRCQTYQCAMLRTRTAGQVFQAGATSPGRFSRWFHGDPRYAREEECLVQSLLHWLFFAVCGRILTSRGQRVSMLCVKHSMGPCGIS